MRSLKKTLQTNRKRTALLGAALLAVAAGLVFAGPVLLDGAGDGAGWVVQRVVHAVAYRNRAPDDGPARVTTRVRVAANTGLPEGALPAATVPAEDSGSGEVAAEDLPPVDLVTPLEEETEAPRNEPLPYRSYGLRDPMIPLVAANGEQDEETQFSVYRLTLVGVAWKGGERAALLEDPARKGYLFRVGDWTKDGGRVVDITENSITFAHVRYGETSRFTLRLEVQEEEQQ